MTKLNVNDRIEKYIEKIDPVNEGMRDDLLYNTGLLLRKQFGLQSDSLSEWLHIVNDKKCLPKLDVADVTKIARSVDKSTEVPLGDDSARCDNTPSSRHNTQKQSGKKYTVTIAKTPVSVADILKRTVSRYSGVGNTPVGTPAIEAILDTFRNGGKSRERILAIRNENDTVKRKELKKQLPSFVFGSEPQQKRLNAHCKHNGILCIDFDNIPIDEIESAKTAIAAVDYVFAVGLSVSGQGLFTLAAYEGTPDLKHLLAGMQNDLRWPVDTSRSDLCGLRFATLDENLIVKDEVYPAVLSEQNVEVQDVPTTQWQPFPIDRLPPTMRNIAIGVQNTIGLKDSSTPAIASLATVSGLIGASCKIRIKTGYLQPAHLYTVIIGKSGQAKSGTKEYLLDVVQNKQSEWYEGWEQENQNYERDLQEWKSIKKGERPECPSEPNPPKRVIVSDITIESVGQRLNENPFGLLLYNDELETFFGNMQRYNNGKDLPHWLSIHNGQPLYVDRKGQNPIRIAHPSVAIIGGIQPVILKDRLKENPDYFHSGFMARFLTAMPPVEPILLNENILPQAALSGWGWFAKSILQQRESAIIDGKLTPHVFPIEQSAWSILKDYQHQHAIPAAFSDAQESALEGKFLTNTARIALILHVVKQIESGELLSDCKPITGDTMESACIIAEWFIEEQKRIYDEFAKMLAGTGGDTTLTSDQQAVMKVLLRAGKAMTKREIKRNSRPCQKLDDEHRLDSILSELVKMKKIRDKFRVGVGIKDGTIEYEFFTVDTVDADEPPKNTGVYGGYGSVNTVDTTKNEISTLPEFDESSDKVSENSPVPGCKNCTHFRRSSYPGGHCKTGRYQQDLPCCDFVAKTPTALF